MKDIAMKATLLKERVVESDTADKVKEVASDTAEKVADGAGFAAFMFGKLLSPVSSRLKKAWDEYKETHKE